MASLIIYPLAVLAIAQAWMVYSKWRQERHERLKERVAFMLWSAVEQDEESEELGPRILCAPADLSKSIL